MGQQEGKQNKLRGQRGTPLCLLRNGTPFHRAGCTIVKPDACSKDNNISELHQEKHTDENRDSLTLWTLKCKNHKASAESSV